MPWTATDVTALKRAIASGVLTVRHLDGRTLTYQSLEDMLKALIAMEAEVAGASNESGIRTTRTTFVRD